VYGNCGLLAIKQRICLLAQITNGEQGRRKFADIHRSVAKNLAVIRDLKVGVGHGLRFYLKRPFSASPQAATQNRSTTHEGG